MVVQTQSRHGGSPRILGLHVGVRNVREYFPRTVTAVELHIDHLVIVCPLQPAFWQGDPEIYDDRLSSWLQSKRTSGKLGIHPSPVTLIPTGESSFRILLAQDERKDPLRLEPSQKVTRIEVMGPVEMVKQAVPAQPAPMKRPVQGVATLKGHDHPALAANY